MKATVNKIALLILMAVLCSTVSAEAREFEKFRPRTGMNNFYSKIGTADTVRIVYFGGSITNAPGWRVKSFNWFEEQYPQTNFKQINASIGGTGSNLGAFRFKGDVLQHDPDLIFMEYAVNDSRTDRESILRQFEGIIRQLWTALPNCDICFVYTFKDEFADAYNSGKLPYTVIAAEEIAEYYGIPSLNFGIEIMDRMNNSTLVFRGKKPQEDGISYFSKDGVHPFKETGHQIYFEDFKTFEEQLSEQADQKLKTHKLPEPLYTDNWQNAKYLSIDAITFTGDWKFPEKENGLYETESGNAKITFEFEGTMLGIYDWIGPSGTVISIDIDGQKQEKLRFDKHCSYNRANYFFIPGLKPGKHRVEIKIARELSTDEKVEIIKERLNYAEDLRSTFIKNTFSLSKVMIL